MANPRFPVPGGPTLRAKGWRQEALLRLAGEGRTSPHISHRLPLEDYAAGMRLLIARRAIGRVVLTMR